MWVRQQAMLKPDNYTESCMINAVSYTHLTFGKNLIAMNQIIKSVILLVKQIGGIYVKRCGNKYFNGIYFKL